MTDFSRPAALAHLLIRDHPPEPAWQRYGMQAVGVLAGALLIASTRRGGPLPYASIVLGGIVCLAFAAEGVRRWFDRSPRGQLRSLLERRQIRDAAMLARRSLASARRFGDARQLEPLLNCALCLLANGELEAALALNSEALGLANNSRSVPDGLRADLELTRALLLERFDRPSDALPLWTAALATAGERGLLAALVHEGLAMALLETNAIAAAATAAERSLALFEQVNVGPFALARVVTLLGAVRREQQRGDDAEALAHRALGLVPAGTEAHLDALWLLGSVLENRGAHARMIPLLEQQLPALRGQRLEWFVLQKLVEALTDAGRLTEAWDYSLRLNPLFTSRPWPERDRRARLLCARVARALHKGDSGVAAFEHLRVAGPSAEYWADATHGLAMVCLESGQLARAAELSAELEALGPDTSFTASLRVDLLLELRRFPEAIAAADRALHLDEDDGPFRGYLLAQAARTHFHAGGPRTQALTEELSARAPDGIDFAGLRIDLDYQSGQFAAALKRCEPGPNGAEGEWRIPARIWCLLALGEVERASEALPELSEDSDLPLLSALVAVEAGRPDDAIAIARKAATRLGTTNPHDVFGLLQVVAWTLLDLGQIAAATAEAARANAAIEGRLPADHPDFWQAKELAGSIAAAGGHFEQAWQLYAAARACRERSPFTPVADVNESRLRVAEVAIAQGRWEQALGETQALVGAPVWGRTRRAMVLTIRAEALARLGRPEAAAAREEAGRACARLGPRDPAKLRLSRLPAGR